MIFILIRIFPFLIPLLYAGILKSVLVLNGQIFWPIVVALVINFWYFLFIFIKKKRGEVFIFILHSTILMLVGFTYLLILSSPVFINLFIIIWSLLYFLYLESIFHHFYQTNRVLLLDLKNIIAYVNLLAFFFLTAFLINLYIFINFSIWLVFLLVGLVAFILIISRLRVNGLTWLKSLVYSITSSILVVEVLVALLYLSVSFYVSALFLAVLYYLLSSFLVLNSKDNLTSKIVWQYLAFTLAVIIIIALTSQWL